MKKKSNPLLRSSALFANNKRVLLKSHQSDNVANAFIWSRVSATFHVEIEPLQQTKADWSVRKRSGKMNHVTSPRKRIICGKTCGRKCVAVRCLSITCKWRLFWRSQVEYILFVKYKLFVQFTKGFTGYTYSWHPLKKLPPSFQRWLGVQWVPLLTHIVVLQAFILSTI